VRRHEGAHRQPIDRGRGNDREVAHAGQRQLQCARDRVADSVSTCTCGPQLLQTLLVADAKMLLLVDDHRPRSLNLIALPSKRVGADHDVDIAVRKPLLDLIQLLRRDQPGSLRDIGRENPETVPQRSCCAAAPAAWSAPRPRPACRRARPQRRRAVPPRSCQSRRRRRSAGPSAGRFRGPFSVEVMAPS